MGRLPRLAIAVLPGLDHFVPDLAAALNATGRVEARVFPVTSLADVGPMLLWADCPASDAIWFEFCWPPFPAFLKATDFGGRRVIVRIHRIEAYGTDHVAHTDWSRVNDVVVVGQDMARRAREAAPEIGFACRLHVIHNGLDLTAFAPGDSFDRTRIGWCGWFSLHKNPLLALEILHRLRRLDERYRLCVSTKGGELVVMDAFRHLARRLDLSDAISFDGAIGRHLPMAAWHRRNGVLLSTSVYESFGYAIAEAAACGCDIAILDNTAAAEFWPGASRFASVEQAVAIIAGARPNRWRALVEQNYDVGRQAHVVADLMTAPLADNSGLGRPEAASGGRAAMPMAQVTAG